MGDEDLTVGDLLKTLVARWEADGATLADVVDLVKWAWMEVLDAKRKEQLAFDAVKRARRG